MAGFILPFLAANAKRNQQQQGSSNPSPDTTLIGSALGRYQTHKAAQNGALSGKTGSQVQAPGAPGVPVLGGVDPNIRDQMMGGPGANPSWGESGGESEPFGYDNEAQGRLVTKPTIARIADKGPELVVPMNSAAGNRVRPDMLEGHLQAPKVPGVRYQQFKGYVKPSY